MFKMFFVQRYHAELRVSERLTLEMIFLPIKLRVTGALAVQNDRYCFSDEK